MTVLNEIVLQPINQIFPVQLNGVTYNMRMLWNSADEGGWTLDIADADMKLLVCGVPLVAGANLLEQYKYLDIGVELFCGTDGDHLIPPTHDNIGSTAHLYWVAWA